LTDQLKNECLNLAGENGELKNRVIQLGDELRAADLKIESLLGNHQSFNGMEGPAQILGDSYQNNSGHRGVANSGGRNNGVKENAAKDNGQAGFRSNSFANIHRGSNSQGYKGLIPSPLGTSFGQKNDQNSLQAQHPVDLENHPQHTQQTQNYMNFEAPDLF
jgi:hypothetical protein